MSTPLVNGLRSVAIGVPDVAAAVRFYVDTWHLAEVARDARAVYLRGSGADHHLLSVEQSPQPVVLAITLGAPSRAAVDALAERVPANGGTVLRAPAPQADPAGGYGVVFRDPQGRILRAVSDGARHADAGPARDRPERLAHVVVNSRDVAAAQAFYEGALGMKLSDRTRIMAFMRCNTDHHSIALADADNDCLNHIAFVMPGLDDVMRGGGRMKDAGYPIHWGPGRHGPGNNLFNYFLGPFGFPIEYTAEVSTVDDSYRVGRPEDWKWPPGRIDQWGIAVGPTPELKAAQRAIGFAAQWTA
ncbi:MAG: VOC family protein [Burkholderiales bacterium]|nr:VOC family protein [Burkholderiales bacterium]